MKKITIALSLFITLFFGKTFAAEQIQVKIAYGDDSCIHSAAPNADPAKCELFEDVKPITLPLDQGNALWSQDFIIGGQRMLAQADFYIFRNPNKFRLIASISPHHKVSDAYLVSELHKFADLEQIRLASLPIKSQDGKTYRPVVYIWR